MMKNLLYVAIAGCMAAAAVATYQNWLIVTIALAFIGVILATLGALWIYNLFVDTLSKNAFEKQKRALELDALAIQNRHNDITTIVANPGQQILVGSTSQSQIAFNPLHLGGVIDGSWVATPPQLRLQRRHSELFAPPANTKLLNEPPPELPPVLPPIMSRLENAHQILISGPTGSGKTTLCQHLLTWLASQGYSIIPCDIHSPGKMLGFDVVGSRRKFEDIFNAIEYAVETIHDRYNHPDYGTPGYRPQPIAIFLDELTTLKVEAEKAKNDFTTNLQTLLIEGRKVGVKLILSIHSLDVRTLGLSSGIRESNTIIQLIGGEGSPYQCYVVPPLANIRHKKDWIEHAPPGPFVGYPETPDVITELPDVKYLRVNNLAAQGFSITSIARTIFDVKKPNGGHIQDVKNILAKNATPTI